MTNGFNSPAEALSGGDGTRRAHAHGAGLVKALLLLAAMALGPLEQAFAQRVAGVAGASAAAAKGGEDEAKDIQRERLEILMQERSKTALELASAAGAPAGPEGAEAHSAQVRRLQSDLRAIEAEIVRVGRAPGPVTREPGTSARVARQSAVAQAAGNPSPAAASDGIAYEGWDVFNDFGKQGKK